MPPLSDTGRPSHHTRVERWECDWNDHWNARFYVRSFQATVETVAGKAFWAVTEITTPDDALAAGIEMCVVTVNLDTRRAVAVPEFMQAALGG